MVFSFLSMGYLTTTSTTTRTHRGCQDRIADALGQIQLHLRDMPTSGALMPAEPSERHGSASAASQSPAFDERDALDRWLSDLAARTATRIGKEPPKLHRCLPWLREWITPMLAGPDAERDGQAVLSWERRLRQIVGAQTVTRMPGTCPACDTRGRLRHTNGDDLVQCAACGASMDWDAYHRDVVGVDGGSEAA